MLKTDIVLSKLVSYQQNTWSDLSSEIAIKDILEWIKLGKYQMEIFKLRTYFNEGAIERYEMHKKRLPAVTFCGTFETSRKIKCLKDYNYLIVIDIDNIDTNQLLQIKQILYADQYVFSFWDSPSGKGIKGLLSLYFEAVIGREYFHGYHKHAFNMVYKYFFDKYNIVLDKSGSDVTRLCFVSYDSGLIVKEYFENFQINKSLSDKVIIEQKLVDKQTNEVTKSVVLKATKSKLFDPTGRNSQINRSTIQSIIKYLRKRNKSITSEYESWYRVGYAIADSFTFDIGEKYYLSLCRLDGSNHDEIQSKIMLQYCYENTSGKIKFSTILYLARQLGYKKGGTEDG